MKELLERYLNGTATGGEQKLVEAWFEAIGGEDNGFSPVSDEEKQELFLQLKASGRYREMRRRRPFLLQPTWKAAAVWSGLLLGGWTILHTARTGKASATQQPAFTTISTGLAEIRKVRLPDSSVLWLNANTRLSYAADFRNHRQVSLEGEALFDVRHQPGHPFVIETPDGLRTEVLGTRFDMRSYHELPGSEVTVIDGRIRVSRRDSVIGELSSGQAVYYTRREDRIGRLTVVHPESLAGWVNGDWSFDNKGIHDLALLLHNQYGIRLTWQGPGLEKAKVSVNFNSRQTAADIIGIFCAFTDSHFRWKDNSTVEIY